MSDIEEKERPISSDLVQCGICKQLMYVYVFKNGDMRTIHKHDGIEVIPSPYIPLNKKGDEKAPSIGFQDIV